MSTSSATGFLIIVACVLIPLGLVLAVGNPPARAAAAVPSGRILLALGFAVGTIGGIYGIGGGSILGPILVTLGVSIYEVAPAALAATFLTSIAGVAAFAALSLAADGEVAPEWALGLAIGLGGLAGGWIGAGLQSRLPEELLAPRPRRDRARARRSLRGRLVLSATWRRCPVENALHPAMAGRTSVSTPGARDRGRCG